MRAFAFLLVFCHHYLRMEVGWVGVDIFFVISGFLITGILYDSRDDRHRVRNFYVRRALRIFPLYYGVWLALLLVVPFCHWLWDWRWAAWPLYVGNLISLVHRGALDPGITNVANGWLFGAGGAFLYVGHFWSLCVEEQFYLVWPWVVFRIRSRRALLGVATAVILLSPLLRWFAYTHLPADRNMDVVAHATFFRLDTLMVGALLALIYRTKARQQMFRAASALIWIAVVVTGAALVAFVIHPALLHVKAVKPVLLTVGFTVIATFAAVLIVRSLVPATIFYRVFSLRPLRWLGRISYGAYIFHDMPHVYYLRFAAWSHIPVAMVALVATIALAWFSFRFFESIFLNMKDRFTVSAS